MFASLTFSIIIMIIRKCLSPPCVEKCLSPPLRLKNVCPPGDKQIVCPPPSCVLCLRNVCPPGTNKLFVPRGTNKRGHRTIGRTDKALYIYRFEKLEIQYFADLYHENRSQALLLQFLKTSIIFNRFLNSFSKFVLLELRMTSIFYNPSDTNPIT